MEPGEGSADGEPGFDSSAAFPRPKGGTDNLPTMSESTAAPDGVAQFYTTSDFDVTESPHTDLDSVPERADIHFAGEAEPRTTAVAGLALGSGTDAQNDAIMDEMLGDSIGIRFLIERAMLDPEATVVPRGA